MTEKTPSAIEKFNDARKAAVCMEVLGYRVGHPTATLGDACAATDVPERTFRSWLAQGVLDDYLAEFSQAMRRAGRDQVLEAWTDVVGYQLKIACGKVQIKGANPVSAAEFCRRVGGIGQAIQELPTAVKEMNIYMIPQGHTVLRKGQPVVEAQAEDKEILDGEIVED